MFRPSNAQQCCKDMKDRFQRPFLIPREQRYYQRVSIILHVCGMLSQVSFFKLLKDMKMKYFLANLTMKVIPLLLGQRITHVAFGEIKRRLRSPSLRSDRYSIIYRKRIIEI